MKKRSILRRSWFWVSLSIVLLIVIALFTTPLLIRVTLNKVVQKLGAEHVDTLGINVNPFGGSLSINDVQIVMDENTTLKVGDLYIKLGWTALFGKKVSIAAFTIRNADLVVEKDDSGKFNLKGMDMSGSGAQTKQRERSKWGFGIILAGVYDSSITFMDDERTIQFVINDAELKGYESWDRDAETRFDLHGTINSVDLKIDAMLQSAANQQRITGHVFLKDLSLGELIEFSVPDLYAVDAMMSIDADIDVLIGADRHIVLKEKGEIALEELEATNDETALAAEKIVWQGNSFIEIGDDVTTQWRIDGTLGMEGQIIELPGKGFSIKLAEFLWEGSIDSGNDNTGPILEGDLGLDDINIANEKMAIAADKLVWRGNVAVGLHSDAASEWEVEGTLGIKNQKLKLLDRNMSVRVNGAEWSGLIGAAEDMKPFVDGNLGFSGVEIEQVNVSEKPDQTSSLVSAKKIGVNEMYFGDMVNFKAGEVSLDALSVNHNALSLNVDAVRFMETSAQKNEKIDISTARFDGASIAIFDDTGSNSLPMAFSRLDLRQISLKEMKTLEIFLIQLNDVATEIRRDVIGEFTSNESRNNEVVEPELQEKDKAGGGFKFHVANFSMQGKNKIVFVDNTVDPNAEFDIVISQLNLRNFGNMKRQEYVQLQAGMEIDNHAKIEASANMEMSRRPPEMDLSMGVDALELSSVAPYLDKAMGYKVDSGQLDLQSDSHIREGILESNNVLIVRNLRVTHFDKNKAKKALSIYASPLESSIKVLSEENSTMEMPILLSVDLNDPKLNLQKQITATVTKAIRDIAGATLGSTDRKVSKDIKVIASEDAGQAADIQFIPVEFVRGTAILNNKAQHYLGIVAQLLDDYPGITLRICGFSTDADRQIYADDENLYSIAKNRALSVKDYLVNEKGIDAKRLNVCPPQIDGEKGAVPRVDLLE